MEQEEQKFTDNSKDFGDNVESKLEELNQQEGKNDAERSQKSGKKKNKQKDRNKVKDEILQKEEGSDNVESKLEELKDQEDKNDDERSQKSDKKKNKQRGRNKVKVEIPQKEKESDNVESKLEELKQQEDKNDDERSQKSDKKKNKQRDRNEVKEEVLQKEKERNDVKDEILQKMKESDNVESQLEQVKQEEDRNDEERSQKSGKKKNKQRDRNKVKVEILQKEKESLEAQLEAATRNKPEQKLCDCITSSPSLREQVKTLNAELENVRKDKEILSRKKRTAKEKKNLLRNEIDELKRDSDQLNKEISGWKNSVALLKNEKDKYVKNVTEKEQQIQYFQEAYKIEKGQFEKMIQEKNKNIQALNAEKTDVTSECAKKDKILDKHVKNIEYLKSRLNELQQMNANLLNIRANQSETITALGQEKEALQEEKKGLMLRLSKLAGANLTYQNPDIADLSDEKRPTKLAEEFSELYDNEWTDAFEEVNIEDEKEKTTFMLELLKRANELCNELAENHFQTIKRSFSTLTIKSKVPPKHIPEGHLNDKLYLATQPKRGTSSKTEPEVAQDPRFEAVTEDTIPKNGTKIVEAEPGRVTALTESDVTQVTHLEADTYSKTPKNGTENEGADTNEGADQEVSENSRFDADIDENITQNDTKYMEANNVLTKTEVTEDSCCQADSDGTVQKNETKNMDADTANTTEQIGDQLQETSTASEDRETAMEQGYQFVDDPVKEPEVGIPSQLPAEEFDGTPVNNFEMGNPNQFAAEQLEESKENGRLEEIVTSSAQSYDRNEDGEPKQKKIKLESNYELLSKEQKKTILEARKLFEKELSGKIERAGTDFIVQELGIDAQKQGMVVTYIQKCMDVCWSMCRLEPPVHVEFTTVNDDIRFDTNTYKPYTKSGTHVDYLVWPAVYLHKNGPMLAKGVAQGKKK